VVILDLIDFFEKYLNQIPKLLAHDSDEEHPDVKKVFVADTLPKPPRSVTSDKIRISLGTHTYTSSRVDELHWYASRSSYRALGLLTLATVLRSSSEDVHVHLIHPKSTIRHLVIRTESSVATAPITLADWPAGYIARPYAFVYYPEQLAYTPFDVQHIPSERLPVIQLTDDVAQSATNEAGPARQSLASVQMLVHVYGPGYSSILVKNGKLDRNILLNPASAMGGLEPRARRSVCGYVMMSRLSNRLAVIICGLLLWNQHCDFAFKTEGRAYFDRIVQNLK
jgi:hypothetical protein